MNDTTTRTEQPALASPPRRVSRAQRFWARLGLSLVAIGVTLLAVEFVLRCDPTIVPALTERDSRVGQKFLPGFVGEIYSHESERLIPLRFNREGFRGPDRPKEKSPGVVRVAILGDSLVGAVEVEEQHTLVCRLERMLNERAQGKTFEVINFGVTGSSTGQELVLYRNLVREYQPDLVLCAFFVGNDLADNSHELSSNPRIYFELNDAGGLEQRPFSAGSASVSALLNRHSRLYVWQKRVMSSLRSKARQATGTIDPGRWILCSQPEDRDVVEAWRLTDALLAQFHADVTADGARFAVVVLPSSTQIYDDYFRESLRGEPLENFSQDYPEQRLAQACEKSDIPMLALKDDFRRAAPSRTISCREEWLYFLGHGHLNERGHAVVAESLARFLEERHELVAGRDASTPRR